MQDSADKPEYHQNTTEGLDSSIVSSVQDVEQWAENNDLS